jgi:hypothetical protein
MSVEVLSFQKEKSLSVVQFRTEKQNTFNYISGMSAIKREMIQVKEINEAGSVNNIAVFNLSNEFVFFMDGDILTGAKQNRVLNTSVLIAPNSNIIMPVSCVERGRWNSSTNKFDVADYSAPHHFRAKKSQEVKENLNRQKVHFCKQARVWNDIDHYQKTFNLESETSNISDIFNEKKNDFDQFIQLFNSEQESNGMCIFINEALLNIEIFNRTDIYDEYFPKILKGAAFDTYNLLKVPNQLTEDEARKKTNIFFEHMDFLTPEVHNGVGCGIEKRFSKDEITGFELNFQDHLIHLTLLNLTS